MLENRNTRVRGKLAVGNALGEATRVVSAHFTAESTASHIAVR